MAFSSASVRLVGNIFDRNRASSAMVVNAGGALGAFGGSVRVEAGTVRSNSAEGGSLGSFGGSIYAIFANVQIIDALVAANFVLQNEFDTAPFGTGCSMNEVMSSTTADLTATMKLARPSQCTLCLFECASGDMSCLLNCAGGGFSCGGGIYLERTEATILRSLLSANSARNAIRFAGGGTRPQRRARCISNPAELINMPIRAEVTEGLGATVTLFGLMHVAPVRLKCLSCIAAARPVARCLLTRSSR